MIEKQKPSFYSVIPATVRYDKRISPNAKLLYAEITSLLKINGKCYATNGYFAKLYGVSKKSVSNWIKSLVKCGYVKTKIIYKKGSKEIEDRYIQICGEGMEENLPTPMEKKVKDNNTTNVDYNNTLTESNNITPISPKRDSRVDDIIYIMKKIVNYHTNREPNTERWYSSLERWLKRNNIEPEKCLFVVRNYYNSVGEDEYMPKVRDLRELFSKFSRLEDYFTDF